MCICIFKAIPGVEKIKDGYNPATWMLEVSASSQEVALGVDFCDIYKRSELYRYVYDLLLGNIAYRTKSIQHCQRICLTEN